MTILKFLQEIVKHADELGDFADPFLEVANEIVFSVYSEITEMVDEKTQQKIFKDIQINIFNVHKIVRRLVRLKPDKYHPSSFELAWLKIFKNKFGYAPKNIKFDIIKRLI